MVCLLYRDQSHHPALLTALPNSTDKCLCSEADTTRLDWTTCMCSTCLTLSGHSESQYWHVWLCLDAVSLSISPRLNSQSHMLTVEPVFPSVLWRCWLGCFRKGIPPIENPCHPMGSLTKQVFFFFFSGMHHSECVAPYVDISLHRGPFWARLTASFSVRL